jgi:hypothetical protein
VAEDESALPAAIAAARGGAVRAVPGAAPPAFLDRLRGFVLGESVRAGRAGADTLTNR